MILDDLIIKAINFEPIRLVSPDAWIKHIPFGYYIVGISKPKLLVELGVHTGNSFSAFAQSVKENNLDTVCYGIDTFIGEKHAGKYSESVFTDISSFIQNNFNKFAYLIKSTFDDCIEQFDNNSIDLLHIDGLHTYDAAKHDFESWLPKVSLNGIILFHDIQVRHEDFGVWKLWDEIKENYKFTYEFRYGYGLGVLCLKKNELSTAIEKFAKIKLENIFYSSSLKIQYKYNFIGKSKELKTTNEELKSTRKELKSINEEMKSARKDLKSTRDELESTRKELKSAHEELGQTKNELVSVYSSISWRWTKPLRRIKKLIQKITDRK